MVGIDRDWECLPLAELQQLDALCNRFEKSLAHDPNTHIEAFVADLAEPQQRLVARELMQLEIERRHALGHVSTPDEYGLRFPQWVEEIQTLARQCIEDLDPPRIGALDTLEQNSDSDNETKTGEHDSHQWRRAQWRAASDAVRWADLPADGVLGHFQLESVIGRGGMGLVVRAHDTKLARDVALKILTSALSRDDTARERFLREARAAAAIRHKHVVTIYAVEEFRRAPFLVMELVEGATLEQYLRDKGKLEGSEIAGLACQIAQGLAAAHKHGLIHRDVKPANILLEKDEHRGDCSRALSNWCVKITDFGLARVAAETRLTDAGLIAGTPQYMSPEQANGQALDFRSDLFSLGSVMYAMCAGRAAFEAESAIAIIRQVVDKPARSLREVSPETPVWLVETIEKLMAKLPDERFQSAHALAKLLDHHLHDVRTDLSPAPSPSRFVGVSGALLTRRTATFVSLALVSIAIMAFGLVMSGRENSVDQINSFQATQVDPSEVASATEFDTSMYEWPVNTPAPAIAPFTPAEAKAHQEAWAKHLGLPVETENSIGMKFRVIPPGEFLMGSSEQEIKLRLEEAKELYLPGWYMSHILSELPQRRVTLTKPFGLSIHEVTRGQFRQFVKSTGHKTAAEKDFSGGGGFNMAIGKFEFDPNYNWNNCGYPYSDDQPVVNVSWNDAQAFCQWLSDKEGVMYRLPTEAEWEYACRSGTTTIYQNGDDRERMVAVGNVADAAAESKRINYPLPYVKANDGYAFSAPVGRFDANPWGLYDMQGNVHEWCQDFFGDYPSNSVTDPTGPEVGVFRARRGGASDGFPELCRPSYRSMGPQDGGQGVSNGFRVARG